MYKVKTWKKAIVIAFMCLSYPQASGAEMLTSADVLGWPADSQRFYFKVSIGMAGLIAAQNDKAHSDCVDQWYFADAAKADTAILNAMRAYPEDHPLGIILAMLQKACGSFRYRTD